MVLARRYRLTASKDIMRVLRTGKRAAAGAFMVYAMPNRSPELRLTVIISKKVDKRATVRNRCRRRVHAILEQSTPTLKTGFDILIYIRQDISRADFSTLEADIRLGCQKVGVWS